MSMPIALSAGEKSVGFANGVVAFFGLMLIFWVLLGLAALVFWVYCLIDILKHEFSGNNKIIWVIVLLGFGPLGMILYWFIGRAQKVANLQTSPGDREKICELCKSPMRIRTLSNGENAGKKYYVCDAYPQCKNVHPV
jgi:hypothetical protein